MINMTCMPCIACITTYSDPNQRTKIIIILLFQEYEYCMPCIACITTYSDLKWDYNHNNSYDSGVWEKGGITIII